MLEKHIEEKVGDYAKAKGFLTYKFTSPGRRAVPDRIYISTNGTIIFMEFKQKGKVLTPAQEREHFRLKDHNVNVFMVDSIEKGMALVDSFA